MKTEAVSALQLCKEAHASSILLLSNVFGRAVKAPHIKRG